MNMTGKAILAGAVKSVSSGLQTVKSILKNYLSKFKE